MYPRTPCRLSHPRATVGALTASPSRLSKSPFTSSLQCYKKLWWEVHEPDAVELQPDKVFQDLLDQSRDTWAMVRLVEVFRGLVS
jgi:hypothetical protein